MLARSINYRKFLFMLA